LRKFFLCLTALAYALVFTAHANAEISRLTVSKAWNRIIKADGFRKVPIFYEKDKNPNAWVKFEDENNFTVHVTKGLMRILKTEDEIAGILGHELGHIRLGHFAKSALSYSPRTSMGINIELEDYSHTVTDSDESSFSRKQETEADDYGTALLRKARYSPRGLYDAVKKIDADGYRGEHNGFNAHPATDERLKHLAEKAGINPGVKDHTVIGMEDIADLMLGR